MTTHLLIVDGQRDFCDGPYQGALAVPGAHDDMCRLADFITRMGKQITHVHLTMDSHQALDIAHPAWWQNDTGDAPAPFTIITAADVEQRRWFPKNPDAYARSLTYVRALAGKGNYPLCVWPPHCLLGTEGHAIHPDVFAALQNWQLQTQNPLNFAIKGLNPWSEHYSALMAEIPDPNDSATELNQHLLASIAFASRVFIAGEALSHCVKATVEDLVKHLGPDFAKKCILLTDATSSVPGFEDYGTGFIADMSAVGMRMATTDTAFEQR